VCDIRGLKGMENELLFIYDNALRHTAKEIVALLEELAI
jgi:hypothetical protein